MKKELIKLSGILCAITLVAALLLAFVNNLTEERILIAAEAAAKNAMEIIIPADNHEGVEGKENVYKAIKDSEVIGYCVSVSVSGFGGPVEMMVGIGTDGSVKGIDILSHSETAGLGAKADSDDFKSRFKDKSPELTVVKIPTENPSEVQAITGATVTSKAVAEGVKKAFETVMEIEGGNN